MEMATNHCFKRKCFRIEIQSCYAFKQPHAFTLCASHFIVSLKSALKIIVISHISNEMKCFAQIVSHQPRFTRGFHGILHENINKSCNTQRAADENIKVRERAHLHY